MNLYQLAENLNQPLFIIEQMSKSEVDGWLQFYKQKSDSEKPQSANLLDNPNSLLAGMLNL